VSGAAEAYADDDLVLREITETPARAGLNINWLVAPSPRKRRAFALRLAAEVEALSEGESWTVRIADDASQVLIDLFSVSYGLSAYDIRDESRRARNVLRTAASDVSF